MDRRLSSSPQTPQYSDDALERSLRRQRGSSRQRESLADVARRVNESPLSTPASRATSSASRRRFSGRFGGNDSNVSQPALAVSPGDFQEWMKMVRLKRVKANNAFTIQLIDCFHSMVKGASFQEATHTLGGCLTVYKNRIASVKDDTSKLLVGVSEKKSSEIAGDDGSSETDGETSDAEGAKRARTRSSRRRMPAGADAFVLPAQKLEIDTNELATTIDPLLRKMSADFDKRGAGALLQYSLKPDKNGRLLLDAEASDPPHGPAGRTTSRPARPISSSTGAPRALSAITEVEEEEEEEEEQEDRKEAVMKQNIPAPTNHTSTAASRGYTADLAHFNIAYFANADMEACEAIPNVDGIIAAVKNPEEGTDALVRSMQEWAMADPSDASIYVDQGGNPDGEEPAFDPAPALGLGLNMDIDDGDNSPEDIDDAQMDADGMDGGMDWDEPDGGDQNIIENSFASIRLPPDGNWLDVGFLKTVDAQQSNWAGPSFWKIRRLRARDTLPPADATTQDPQSKPPAAKRAVAKAPTVIDFLNSPDVIADELFATSKASINLPARSYDESDKHLLPIDMRVTTAQLVNLALRPHTGIAPAFKRDAWSSSNITDVNASGDFSSIGTENDDEADANAGGADQDDGFFYGGWDDVDPGPVLAERPLTASAMFSQSQPAQQFYGTRHQLNYARVAKHVDVRKLKDKVWTAIGSEAGSVEEPQPTTLLNVIKDVQPQYSEQQRADLSPAMYFISLLHLSNEKGMKLENLEGLTDIRIIAQ